MRRSKWVVECFIIMSVVFLSPVCFADLGDRVHITLQSGAFYIGTVAAETAAEISLVTESDYIRVTIPKRLIMEIRILETARERPETTENLAEAQFLGVEHGAKDCGFGNFLGGYFFGPLALLVILTDDVKVPIERRYFIENKPSDYKAVYLSTYKETKQKQKSKLAASGFVAGMITYIIYHNEINKFVDKLAPLKG